MSAILLVDNVFSPVQYPDVTLSANEEAGGSEAEQFAALRRETFWAPTTTNADAWMKARHTQPRAINTVCLWAHNLLGKAYQLQISNDDFASGIETIVSVTIPSAPGTGDIDDDLGVVTEDLMWIKRLAVTRYAHDIRHFVPAMGANQLPNLTGIVGVSYAFDRDLGELVDATDFRADQQRSDRGVDGFGTSDIARNGRIPISLPSLFDYEAFRFHLQRYDGTATGTPIPALLIFDEARAEQAVMAHRPTGRLGFEQNRSYFYPSGKLEYVEHDPREAR